MNYCTNCGNKLKENSNFCTSCGKPTKNELEKIKAKKQEEKEKRTKADNNIFLHVFISE